MRESIHDTRFGAESRFTVVIFSNFLTDLWIAVTLRALERDVRTICEMWKPFHYLIIFQ